MRKKITVIGAGNVGATCAFRIAKGNYADGMLLRSHCMSMVIRSNRNHRDTQVDRRSMYYCCSL